MGSSAQSQFPSAPATSAGVAEGPFSPFTNSPIGQKLSGSYAPLPEAAGNTGKDPNLFQLMGQQRDYWQQRRDDQSPQAARWNKVSDALIQAGQAQEPQLPVPSPFWATHRAKPEPGLLSTIQQLQQQRLRRFGAI